MKSCKILGSKKIKIPNVDLDLYNLDLDVKNIIQETKTPSGSCADLERLEKVETSKPLKALKTTTMNLFDIISMSDGLDLSVASIMSKLEEVAVTEDFRVYKKLDGTLMIQGNKEGRNGKLAIDAKIFEFAPSLHMVEVKMLSGDTVEYHKFCDQI
ncbi:hypothetical protein L1987_28908 [Smallanthus sonchifolius]|uniref:Uncharacterized protein n=1 Tax=Smallanthus sonchifolius TaxID=185202 RepID=A0ACB9HZA9_9ASTR|nr:hypothetical protein L1987_28908 [Smallanthus sonchifolius]